MSESFLCNTASSQAHLSHGDAEKSKQHPPFLANNPGRVTNLACWEGCSAVRESLQRIENLTGSGGRPSGRSTERGPGGRDGSLTSPAPQTSSPLCKITALPRAVSNATRSAARWVAAAPSPMMLQGKSQPLRGPQEQALQERLVSPVGPQVHGSASEGRQVSAGGGRSYPQCSSIPLKPLSLLSSVALQNVSCRKGGEKNCSTLQLQCEARRLKARSETDFGLCRGGRPETGFLTRTVAEQPSQEDAAQDRNPSVSRARVTFLRFCWIRGFVTFGHIHLFVSLSFFFFFEIHSVLREGPTCRCQEAFLTARGGAAGPLAPSSAPEGGRREAGS